MKELKLYGQPNVVIALAANKSDLEKYRVVSTQEGQAYARDNEMSYFETSAKSAYNVRKMFVDLGDRPPVSSPRSRSLLPAFSEPRGAAPAAQPSVCRGRMRCLLHPPRWRPRAIKRGRVADVRPAHACGCQGVGATAGLLAVQSRFPFAEKALLARAPLC